MPKGKKWNKPLLNESDIDEETGNHDEEIEGEHNIKMKNLSQPSTIYELNKSPTNSEKKMKIENKYMNYIKSRLKKKENCEIPIYNSILDDENPKEDKEYFLSDNSLFCRKNCNIQICNEKESNTKSTHFKGRIKCFNKYLKHHVHKISNGENTHYLLQSHELLKIVHHIKEEDIPINSSGLAQYRDIRQLLSSNDSTRFEISPKRNCVLINLPYRKCIIFKNLLLYIPTFTNNPIPEIVKKEEKSCKCFIENSKLISTIKDSLPFEILILESIFVDIYEELKNEIEPVICETEKLFDIISNNPSVFKCINKLTDMRRKLKIIDEKVQSVYKAIHDVLSNDDDIRRLEVSYFGDKPEMWEKCELTPYNEDTEMLLEYYCHEIEEFLKIIHRTNESLDDVLQMVELNLDDARNDVLKLELGLKIYGIIIAVVGTIAGIFGMNLKNGFESEQYIFWTLALFLMFITSCCLFYVITSFKKVNI
ncbi:CorA-like Mg2+ transporter protein, putative [Plasmodium chabaudi chabaudi]|uniref:Magnesium transporter n=1 Tax=Plasmodium chabaudi chabaudi TaxID=31271 RepID=A0A077YDQ5_PLACU|nr:CorA-like Mg2+ transporter protein, putative [Plasmodium chabaudi chabaudi]SCM02275.1 CorA-like Mg2+ transporter protein, putative [Plasmodium chabaudi chabaudi]SCM04437.1 CorA-like Mg2+ transporter protein, putative [Plasmodium chabaudi chabaudi]VTZ66514.1 CorA-like Mg2+ transporter protein, putative [Plasmodium chabaudi chabaudi]|eukprot:XP_733271.2 CorA-like Mg2+ transporter protein, putative [Plasmodium chabaudi chabaudi]